MTTSKKKIGVKTKQISKHYKIKRYYRTIVNIKQIV